MEKKLVSLMMANELEKLRTSIEKIPDEEIVAMVRNSSWHDCQAVSKLIAALFKGLGSVSASNGPASTAAGEVTSRRRMTLTSAILKLMTERDVDTKSSADVIGVLLTEMDSFPAWCLVRLSKEITEYIRNPSVRNFRFLEILPKLVHLLREQDSVPVDTGHMNGPEYKGALINTICSARWPGGSVVHLASTFKEIQLSPEELDVVVKKCLKLMNCVELDEVPPLVYQLLILSAKGGKREVIEGIVDFFYDKTVAGSNPGGDRAAVDTDSMDLIEDSAASAAAATSSRLQQTESTVVFHVTSSVKQNQELGREFLKYFKANQLGDYKKMLSSFVISLALSISKIDVFENQVIELLRKTVTFCYKDQRRKQDSMWLRGNSPGEAFDVTRCVLDSVEKNTQGWDIIMEGLVSFAFSLMEASSAKNNFGKPARAAPVGARPTPDQSLNLLGGKILEFCSKVHRNVAMEIAGQLINRIVTKGSEHVSSHFIDLLTKLLKSSPHNYLEKSQDFKDIFDYFAFLPVATSRSLLAAVLPVARVSPSLKNSLILVLRKSLFSRQIEMRKVAVVGFLLLLKNFRVLSGFYSSQSQPSASQVEVDVHRARRANQSEADNKSLCLEILGTLKRCLGQQSEIRSLLYEGLFEVVAANPFLAGAVVEVLFSQLHTYFDPEEGNACPLKVTSSMSLNFDLWVVSEPLPDLISNLIFCVASVKSGSTEDTEECRGVTERSDVVLDSMVTRIVKCDVDDFEMDKNVDFDTSTNAGSRNSSLAGLTSGICEVLMMREVICFEPDQQRVERVLQLFRCLCRITDAAQEGQPNRKVRVKKATSDPHKVGTLSCRYLSLNFLVRVVKMMFDSEQTDISVLLLGNNDFVNYVFNSATTLLQNLPATSALGEGAEFCCRGYPAKDRERFVKDCFDLGRILLKRYLRIALRSKIAATQSSTSATTGDLNGGRKNNNDQQPDERPGSAKQINAFCLKVFHQVLSLVAKQLPDRLEEFLDKLDIITKTNKRVVEKDKAGKLNTYVKIFQRIFFTLLTSGDDSASSRDRLTSMQCVVVLLDACHGEKREEVLAESYNWLLRLFKERVIDDLELLKLITKQLLGLMRCTDSSLTFLKEVTKDVHLCMGDVNQEAELDRANNKHASVSLRSSPPIIQLILGHLEQEVEDSEWLICRMRCQLGVASSSLSANEGAGGDDLVEDGNSRDSSSVDAGNQAGQPPVLSIKDVNRSLIGRLSCVTDVFNELVQTAIPLGPITEHLLKVLNGFYCLLSTVVKLYIWKFNNKSKEVEVHVSGRFEKFIKHTAVQLTRLIYPMITYIENMENERLQAAGEKKGKKKTKKTDGDGKSEKIKRMKETRFVPTLILSAEQYEKLLIQLSKKSKVDLMVHFKLSTARDFRINAATLQAALDQQQQQDEDEDDDDDEDDGNNDDDDGGAASLVGDDEPSRHGDDDDEEDGGGNNEPSTSSSSRAQPPAKRSKLTKILPNKSAAKKRAG